MIQALENGEKPRFGPDLDPLGLKSGRVFFFFFFSKTLALSDSLDIMVSNHHVQYQKKLMT